MNRQSQLDLFQSFMEKQQQRSKIQIGGEIEAVFDFCQYIIHTQYDKQSKKRYKFKERKKQVSEDFMRAYSTLDREDKIMYYNKNVIYLTRLSSGNFKMPKLKQQILQGTAYTKSYNLGSWKQKKIRLDYSRQFIFGQRNNSIKQYDLGNYIFRGSKNTKFYTFVLQAIKESVPKKLKTVHFGFQSYQLMKQWAESVQLCIDYKHWQRIYIQLFKKLPPKFQVKEPAQTQIIQQNKQIVEQKRKSQVRPVYIQAQNVVVRPNIVQVTKLQEKKIQVKTEKNDNSFQQFQSDSSNQKGQGFNQNGRTIIQDLVEGDAYQTNQTIENRNKIQKNDKNIKNLNIFHRMFPDFQFDEAQSQVNHQMIHNERTMRILQSLKQKIRYKIILDIRSQQNVSCLQVFKILSGAEFIKGFNENVQQSSIKAFISSENAAIMYMVLKAFNRLYRSRDFIFIRHCFNRGQNQYYIADKQIQNENYPPFMTIVRGKYQCVWSILKINENYIKLVGNIKMDNSGYLNDNQNTNLVLNYLKNFNKLVQYIHNNLVYLKTFSMFDEQWDITKNKKNQKQNQVRVKRKTQKIRIIKQRQSIKNNQMVNDINYTPRLIQKKIQIPQPVIVIKTEKQLLNSSLNKQKQLLIQKQKMNSGQIEPQVDPKDLQNLKLETKDQIKLRFDSSGMVIIQKGFIKHRYQLTPTKQYSLLVWESPIPGTHPIWVHDWKHDFKNGGLLFINQKKIDDQKSVLKFILSKIGKNLLSGKSVLNVSLPVDIFTPKSNLQLFTQSICYAPILLQKASKLKPFDKFKIATTFGITLSLLYLIMEKPFNPILGETFQAWINGCPAYAQQISHHPPICSIYFIGRGYTITGQFESKAQVHMNSGTGTNDGIMRINFNDGTKICFCSAGGEVSGLTYGDRKFNVQGKGYCWSETQRCFTQITYNPSKKGFFSMKKQQQPEDYFQGDVYQVSEQFLSSLQFRRRTPIDKQIRGTFGKFKGTWHKDIYYNQQLILDINNQLPCRLQYQKNPLPSDSNWRQDIAYRRLMQVTRAQTQKQRLEVIQRNDRKLRQKRK